MKISDILAGLNAPGTFVKVSWQSPVTVAAANKHHDVRKSVTAVVRSGITYDNVGDVIAGREDGTLPAENAGLPDWQEWVIFPYHLRHTSKGTDYVRLYPAKGGKVMATYTVDGREASRDEVLAMMTPSARAKAENGETPLCFNVKAENVVGVG